MNAVSQATVEAAPARSPLESDEKAVDGWLNEGGHLEPVEGSEHEALRDTIERIGRAFQADFRNGLVGQHHNTFQHRSRVLRQLTARLRVATESRGT